MAVVKLRKSLQRLRVAFASGPNWVLASPHFYLRMETSNFWNVM